MSAKIALQNEVTQIPVITKDVVVTGGKGFIGNHLVKRLKEKGRNVYIADLPEYNLTDFDHTLKALEGTETVFHLACDKGGLKYLHGSKKAEIKAWRINSRIDNNVFTACEYLGVKNLIYPSSCAVYPMWMQRELGSMLSENLGLSNAEGGYGYVKQMGERHLDWMRENKEMRIAIPRFFNIYGEGEPDKEKAHAVYDLCRKAIKYPNEPFIIWGDGNQTRDYIYIDDAVDVLMMLEGKDVPPTNFASGKATSINKLANLIIKISGKDIKPLHNLNEPVGPISRTAKIGRAKSEFKWSPKVSLEEGLKRTYKWVEKQYK